MSSPVPDRIVTLEELLALPTAVDRAEVVDIPGLGKLKVRPLSLAEAQEMRKECWRDVPGKKEAEFDDGRWQTLIFTKCVVEPKMSFDDAARLRLLPSRIIDQLYQEILTLGGVVEGGGIAEKAVQESEASFHD
jgi:hypothetical protein